MQYSPFFPPLYYYYNTGKPFPKDPSLLFP